ncbi:hypothetical protein SAMN05444338_11845 [Flavobacterium degerlachei]|jgi:hypothetical protein|uniref:Uncharacterized protein n=1 Tax=Flavobacterium degerlachei TaxID=229203 RepID=A0A1H3FLR7_9FLAO|nr:hypothetical protein SAMN05444338_11845 [Flavobacterium degerlachei]
MGYITILSFSRLFEPLNNVLKNQKNCFLLQTAILIFASDTVGQTDEVLLLKITDENILQLVKTIH